ncbi:putative Diguanylate cyclase [Thiomonas sp. X19]|uniref:diguanylate cyclase domain-containing protein n=1 Tax=Thiomonas sp. X19 TaxID=1050370 RepID=UPI000B74DC44|nr:diguanylate cyclase [Thiomonas sp. X19]SCC92755.1 putative Diguanylate cyclase [Thiomonas sp. X19]
MDDPATLPLLPAASRADARAAAMRKPSAPTLARLGWRLMASAAGLFATLVGLWLWSSWETTRHDLEQRSELTATLLAVNAETTFLRIQDDLQQLGDTLQNRGALHDPVGMFIALDAFKSRHPELGGATVFSPDGQMLASTASRPTRSLPNVLQEPAYADYRDDFNLALATQGLSVGRPQYGLLLKQWFIPLRYAVRGADGQARFVVQTSMLLEHQQALWRGLPTQPGVAMGLLRTDGWLISRYPDQPSHVSIYGQPAKGALVRALRSAGDAWRGIYTGKTADGEQREGAWARLRDFPIVAFLSYTHDEVMQMWWADVRAPLLALGGMLALLITAYTLLLRNFVRRMVRIRRQMDFVRAEELPSSGVAEIDALLRQLVRSREHMRRFARNREKALLEAAQAGTYTRSLRDGVLVAADSSFARMLQRPVRRLIGREWDELFNTVDEVPVGEAIGDAKTQKRGGRRLVWTRGLHGETIWLSLAEHAETTAQGHKVIHGLAIDVSERENLLRAVERQSQRLQTLWELATGSSMEDPGVETGDAIAYMLAQGRDALDMQAAIICLRLGDECHMLYVQDLHGRFRQGQTLSANHPLCACDDHENGALWIADTSLHPNLAATAGVRSVIRLPLVRAHQTLGCLLLLGDDPQGEEFDPTDRQYAELLAAWFARVLHDRNQRDTLLAQAYTDGLTGLLNRRAAQLRLDEALQSMRRGGQSFSLALCDLDHFKLVNDEYGHAAGDAVLRQMASTLRQGVPRGGWVARWGGEEFLIMLPGLDTQAASAAMDVLRQRVAQRPFLVSERSLHITLSIGIGGLQGPQDEVVRVLTEADDSLYEAKRQGRNRVITMR